jgi:hypothetical protein
MSQTSANHPLDLRDPEQQGGRRESIIHTPEAHREYIAALMARTGAWQALMRQNELRANKRRHVA